jgi:hypothetical protein
LGKRVVDPIGSLHSDLSTVHGSAVWFFHRLYYCNACVLLLHSSATPLSATDTPSIVFGVGCASFFL